MAEQTCSFTIPSPSDYYFYKAYCNAADQLIFQTEKQIKDYGDKIPADKKATIEAAVNDLRAALKSEDLDQVDKASEALNNAWQAASQDMYQASQQQGGPQNGGPQDTAQDTAGPQDDAGNDADDVTDVEYEEVDDKK